MRANQQQAKLRTKRFRKRHKRLRKRHDKWQSKNAQYRKKTRQSENLRRHALEHVLHHELAALVVRNGRQEWRPQNGVDNSGQVAEALKNEKNEEKKRHSKK
jgi:hypothetical protein